MPLARKLMAQDDDLVLVHRDHLRASFEARLDEGHITILMGDLARGILRLGRSPIVVAWNLHPMDCELWTRISGEFKVPMNWLDTGMLDVAAMIPPLEPAPTSMNRPVELRPGESVWRYVATGEVVVEPS